MGTEVHQSIAKSMRGPVLIACAALVLVLSTVGAVPMHGGSADVVVPQVDANPGSVMPEESLLGVGSCGSTCADTCKCTGSDVNVIYCSKGVMYPKCPTSDI